jgi:hypothetical protein
VRRSASGAGSSPFARSCFSTKASIGVRTKALSSVKAGTAGRVGAMNDQCGWYCAPSWTQRRRSVFCASVTTFLVFGGGITSVGSVEQTRSMSELLAGLPGTIAPNSTASSRRSSRRSALRAALSAPWQAKQLSARIGRMSRLYSIFAGDGAAAGCCASAARGANGQPTAAASARRPAGPA